MPEKAGPLVRLSLCLLQNSRARGVSAVSQRALLWSLGGKGSPTSPIAPVWASFDAEPYRPGVD